MISYTTSVKVLGNQIIKVVIIKDKNMSLLNSHWLRTPYDDFQNSEESKNLQKQKHRNLVFMCWTAIIANVVLIAAYKYVGFKMVALAVASQIVFMSSLFLLVFCKKVFLIHAGGCLSLMAGIVEGVMIDFNITLFKESPDVFGTVSPITQIFILE